MQTVGGNTWIERLAASKRGAKLMKTPQVLETDAAQIETEFSNSRAAGAEWLTSPRAEGPQGPVLNKSKRMLGIRSFSPIGGLSAGQVRRSSYSSLLLNPRIGQRAGELGEGEISRRGAVEECRHDPR
jgi:hypothetical protein